MDAPVRARTARVFSAAVAICASTSGACGDSSPSRSPSNRWAPDGLRAIYRSLRWYHRVIAAEWAASTSSHTTTAASSGGAERPKPVSVSRDVAASRQQVWDVMADGWTYSQWLVGNSRMRVVDGCGTSDVRPSDIPNGCRVEMDEVGVRGPMSWMPHPAQAIAFWLRNLESLWRLGPLAERLKPSDLD